VWSLKPERWGSLLVQENYQEERACDKRHNNNNNNNNNNNKLNKLYVFSIYHHIYSLYWHAWRWPKYKSKHVACMWGKFSWLK
jgi:hypothetical protein